jgi:hypothetical protein
MVHVYQGTADKPRRERGVILSDHGLHKLQGAKREAEYRENYGQRFTLENLTERTEISKDTLVRVFAAEEKVDKKTLKSCFAAFGLSLQPEDYYHPTSARKEEIIELPNGQVPLHSKFYVERSVEADCYQVIEQPGSLIRIKAARGMGKTSLLGRILDHGQQRGYKTVSLSLQLADRHIFRQPSHFWQWFCTTVSLGLRVRNRVSDYWDSLLGNRFSCKSYFENYLLQEDNRPVIVAIDEADILFQYPDLADDFLALLRTFYEGAKNNTTLQKLRFVILQATDSYLPVDTNQSPFNIGFCVELPELTSEQVTYLAQKYDLSWSNAESNQLLKWVGGNPYLIRLALHNIYHSNTTLEQIISTKINSETYIYKEHLQQQLKYIEAKNLGLGSAFAKVIKSQEPAEIELVKAMMLEGLGLINCQGKQASPRCQLYVEYFRSQLN